MTTMGKAQQRSGQSSERRASRGEAAKVMLVDDHPLVRRGLVQLVESEPGLDVCCDVGSAGEAIKACQQLSPDLVVIDISLGDMNGLELIKQLTSQHENLKVLVSSMHDESLFAERALHAGAMGYLNKSEAPERVLEAIWSILDGDVFLSTNMTSRMLQRMRRGEEPSEGTSIDKLSDRELEVFQMIGEGLTTREIASRLHLSPKTVETYREHIKEKLKLRNSNELVRQAVCWRLESSE